MADTTISNLSSVTTPLGNDKLVLDRGDKTYNIRLADLFANSISAFNVGTGECSVISGGTFNTASGDCSTIGGGGFNIAEGNGSTISGGLSGKILVEGENSNISGGFNNRINEHASTIGGGKDNTVLGPYSNIDGGEKNCVVNCYSTVGGGCSNLTDGVGASIGGGSKNDVEGDHSTIGGGICNKISGNNSTIGGGFSNEVCKNSSVIAGGQCNFVNACYSGILGGRNNKVNSNHRDTFIIGSNVSSTASNTTYVGCDLCVCGTLYTQNVVNANVTQTTAVDLSARHVYADTVSARFIQVSSGGTSDEWDQVYTTLNANSGFYVVSLSAQPNTIVISRTGNDVFLSLSDSLVIPGSAHISNNALFMGDVDIIGNLFVEGSSVFLEMTKLSTLAPLLYLGNTLSGNYWDIGLIGNFTEGFYQHTGLIRASEDDKWVLFSGVTSEPTDYHVILTEPTFKIDTLRANIEGNLMSATNVFGYLSSNNFVYGTNIKYQNWDSNYTTFQNQSARNASVFTTFNTQSARNASVFTTFNTQSASNASVFTTFNTQSARNASVFTTFNTQSASNASVFTTFNTQSASNASVFTTFNTQSASNASVFTTFNTQSASNASVFTTFNTQSASNASVFTTFNTQSAIRAHTLNNTTSAITPVLGGNTAGTMSFVGGGSANNAFQSQYQFIGGGQSNQTGLFPYSFVGAGSANQSSGLASVVVGGVQNNTQGCYSSIVGGRQNQTNATSDYTVIGGGCRNLANGSFGFIAGGQLNSSNGLTNVFILGSSLTANQANFTYVNNLSSSGTVRGNNIKADNWDSVYSTFQTQSSNNDSVFSFVNFVSSSIVTKYAETIGDGVASSFNINHNLGTRDVVTQVYNTSAYDLVFPSIKNTNELNTQITFLSAVPLSSFRVVIHA